ncbi:MAG: FAD-dependent oxidoreductase [Proteobacteria bacterium]|nr:FAD-dependent oxidoreductase [Pseudomonadota bacterium]
MEQILIIGGVAAGPKTACHLKRIKPEAKVTLIDQDRLISYGGCGIPYFISGEVADEAALRSTSFDMVRDESFFQGAKGVDIVTSTRATAIDRQAKTVRMKNVLTGEESSMSYDKLVLATGSRPATPPIAGTGLKGVFTIGSLRSAIDLQKYLKESDAEKAVIIGGGAIGIEMAEGLEDMWGLETTIVEFMPQLLPNFVEKPIEMMLAHHLKENNVEIFTSESVATLEADDNGHVARVVTNKRTIEAELVIISAGVRPRDELAGEAGLVVSPRGGVIVNDRLQTSDPDIYAAGDCIETFSMITGKKTFAPLGSLANRQGRVVADNLAGIYSTFDGVVGSFIMKAFNVCVGTVGLTLAAARAEGFDAEMVITVQADRAHFIPSHENITLVMVFDKKSRRVLGVQGFSVMGDSVLARINAAAGLISKKARIEDFSQLEMAYAPPFSTALDALNTAANVADNKACGRFRSLQLLDFIAWIGNPTSKPDWVVVDTRSAFDAQHEVEKFGDRWLSLPYPEIRARYGELPRDKHMIIICGAGTRSYEVQIFLDSVGLNDNIVLGGSVMALRQMGFDWLAD